jgi:hypothetical protein
MHRITVPTGDGMALAFCIPPEAGFSLQTFDSIILVTLQTAN